MNAGKLLKSFNFRFWAILTIINCQLSIINSSAQVMQLGGDTLEMDYTHPKDFIIEGLRTSGTKHLEESVLIDNTGLHKGDSIQVPGEKITNAIKNLWKQGFFSDVKIVAEKIIDSKIFLDI